VFDDENIKIFKKCEEKLKDLRRYTEESEKWILEEEVITLKLNDTLAVINFFLGILFEGS